MRSVGRVNIYNQPKFSGRETEQGQEERSRKRHILNRYREKAYKTEKNNLSHLGLLPSKRGHLTGPEVTFEFWT